MTRSLQPSLVGQDREHRHPSITGTHATDLFVVEWQTSIRHQPLPRVSQTLLQSRHRQLKRRDQTLSLSVQLMPSWKHCTAVRAMQPGQSATGSLCPVC